MTQPLVDLRSDTLTQPTAAMREAMYEAVVGDDGYGEDPTVAKLESLFANLVGKEAAIFVPSGVMANQMAMRVHTRPGDVVISGRTQHVVGFEMGASAANASVQFNFVDDVNGVFNLEEVASVLDAQFDHQPTINLVSLENSHMASGGRTWAPEQITALKKVVGPLPMHLDGARLLNAAVARGVSPKEFTTHVDTVMTCLSKGLCAPVGSLLAGSQVLMDRARIERKRLGGAMRQAGFLAAAGIVALDTMIDRLADDHARAKVLAEAFAQKFPESNYDPAICETNIVSFNHPQARKIVARLEEVGVAGGTVAPQRARFVTSALVDDAAIERAVSVVKSLQI